MEKYDLIVIGGGPGGYIAAIRAAQLGASVLLVEKDKLGGTCLNHGCIPTKALIACTNFYDKIKKVESYGISTGGLSIDLPKIIERKNNIVEKLVKGLERLMQENKIEVIYGETNVLGKGEVQIKRREEKTKKVQGGKIILATGSIATSLPGIQYDGRRFLSSNDILNLKEVPQKLNIIGGGVIGIHFAQIFGSLGTEVAVYEALPEILSGIDHEVVSLLKRILKRKKVNILTGTPFNPAQSADPVLICIGRTPNLGGLENLTLKMDGKWVWTNDRMETSIRGIYAVGDLTSRQMLANVAYEQGVIAAENALKNTNRTFDPSYIPIGLYTDPEIASVGLTEIQAKEKSIDIKIGKFPFAALGIANAAGAIEGFIKVITDDKNMIVGVHIIGAEATSLIGEATLAIKNRIRSDQLADIFQPHPSYPEGLQEASLTALNRSLHTFK